MIRKELIQRYAAGISKTLDASELSPHERFLCLRSLASLALGALPPQKRVRALIDAHVADLVTLDHFNGSEKESTWQKN